MMIEKILQWLKGVWSKMIGLDSIKTYLGTNVSLSSEMTEAIKLWSDMYENKSPWLKDGEVFSLNIAGAVTSEISRAVTLEMSVDCGKGTRAAFLQKQLDRVIQKSRVMVEYGAAKGGIMFKPYPKDKSIEVDFIQADQFYPTEFDSSGSITGCIFADQKNRNGNYYTKLEYHHFGEANLGNGNKASGYVIQNMAFKSATQSELGTQVPLDSISEWADIQPIAVISIDRPLFAYFKYPLANNVDPSSPVGVSCFSRAVGLIEQADKLWSNLVWEFDSGQRALYADVLAFTNENGKKVLPMKRLYRALNGTNNPVGGNPEGLFHEWSPDFREQSILSGLDAVLKKIEFQCGLSYGTISDPSVEAKTATEIVISRQRTYATITDAQKSLQNTLDQLLWAMDIWTTLNKLAPAGKYQAVYEFDDSVVVDKDTMFQQDMRLVQQGLMSKVEFRMRNFGEDETTAKKMILLAKEDSLQESDLFQGA
jgi:A118 family predicted phage portal protein